jgi:hypothetical protein
MKYIAYVRQDIEGCDYTIGCAQTLWRLKAQTYDEALRELRDEIVGQFLPEYADYEEGYWGEDKLKQVTLFGVEQEVEIPLELWYAEGKKRVEEYKIRINEEAERAEFERLREKYG